MTITAIARQLNTSTMTIYRKLKRAGVDLDTLRDADGEITTAGASVIASLFDATAAQQAVQQVTTDNTTGNTTDAALTIAILRERLTAAENTIKQLEREREQLLNQLERATAALEREQTDRQHERLLLTHDSNQQRHGPFWKLFNAMRQQGGQ